MRFWVTYSHLLHRYLTAFKRYRSSISSSCQDAIQKDHVVGDRVRRAIVRSQKPVVNTFLTVLRFTCADIELVEFVYLKWFSPCQRRKTSITRSHCWRQSVRRVIVRSQKPVAITDLAARRFTCAGVEPVKVIWKMIEAPCFDFIWGNGRLDSE